jgi:hypothetical protein
MHLTVPRFLPHPYVCLTRLVCLCLLAAVGLPHAADAERPPEAFRCAITAYGTGKLPVGELGKQWEPYATGGVLLELPTGLRRLHTSIGMDAGQISSEGVPDRELLALEFHATVSYDMLRADRRFGLRPLIGIVSMALFRSRSLHLERHVFQTSESEFGFAAGVEPLVRFRGFRFGLPLKATCILSAPDLFTHVCLGCALSREF